jgi:hypothetical protein
METLAEIPEKEGDFIEENLTTSTYWIYNSLHI